MSTLLEQALAEMSQRKGVLCELYLGASEAFVLIVTIQLALHHPAIHGFATDKVRALAYQLQAALNTVGPATREVCRRGWDEAFGVEREP